MIQTILKKITIYIIFLLAFTNLLFPKNNKEQTQVQVKEDTAITQIMNKLFNAYQNQNFNIILPLTTGEFKDNILNILSYQQDNKNQLPPHIKEIVSHLKSSKILGQGVLNTKAMVTMDWVLLYTEKLNPYVKVLTKEYHLIKQNNSWKITNVKNKGENYLVNK